MTQVKARSVNEMETQISQAMIRFEKEFMGRGPFETRTYLIDDMILVRLKGVLLPSEIKLAEAAHDPRARVLIKEMRQAVLERGRPWLETVILDIVGVPVQSVHTDISTRRGERVIVFTLERKPDRGRTERNGDCPVNRPLDRPMAAS